MQKRRNGGKRGEEEGKRKKIVENHCEKRLSERVRLIIAEGMVLWLQAGATCGRNREMAKTKR